MWFYIVKGCKVKLLELVAESTGEKQLDVADRGTVFVLWRSILKANDKQIYKKNKINLLIKQTKSLSGNLNQPKLRKIHQV